MKAQIQATRFLKKKKKNIALREENNVDNGSRNAADSKLWRPPCTYLLCSFSGVSIYLALIILEQCEKKYYFQPQESVAWSWKDIKLRKLLKCEMNLQKCELSQEW